MRVLITGGAGFIGSHLADHLLARGHRVWAVDDLSTGSINNIAHLRNHPRWQFRAETIMNVPFLAELVDECDVIFHLAAAVGVRLIVESPAHTINTNIRGTEIVLELAAKKRKRVVIASTSEVYGKSEKVPFHEEDDFVIGSPLKGRWSYACSKAIDECLALAYWKERQLPVIIVRFFNIVGPRQTGRYGMVLPNFVRQALANQPITIFGDGRQTRCFACIEDIPEALEKLVTKPEAVGQIFNLGSDEEISIEDLAERVRRITGSSSEIVHIPYAEAYEEGFEDMLRRVPSLEKVNQWIGYRPKTPIDQTIEKVTQYYKSQMNEDVLASFRDEEMRRSLVAVASHPLA
ncbi:MAG TPA: GDP-mannose 4,6-dehydratase [Candidatus Dormibacteraeota bacterium]|nr:GDP-mannose 4,6-dehydratase [Candidatus Dormibacteraeota bacterium]